MAAELERLAQRFKENGYIDEGAVLKAQATIFRRGGIPEELPPANEATGSSLIAPEAKEPVVMYPDLRRGFIEACATIPQHFVDKRHPVLSEDFALQLNQRIGQRLPDDMRLEDLHLKQLIKYSPQDTPSNSPIEYRVDEKRVTNWNHLLQNLEYTGFDTIASIRAATTRQIFEQWESTMRRRDGNDYITRITKPQATFIRAVFNQPT